MIWHEICLAILGITIVSYLLGSLNFGIILTWLFVKKDIRTMGSGNTGMTNVLRSVGSLAGALTGFGDFAKGAAAILFGSWLARLVAIDVNIGSWLAAVFVLVGHLYPVFYNFKGGKAVMTSAGVILVLNPVIFLFGMILFLVIFLFSRIVSLSALVTACALPVISWAVCFFSGQEWVFPTVFSALIAILLSITLRDNIVRLRKGEEKKLVVKKTEPREIKKKTKEEYKV